MNRLRIAVGGEPRGGAVLVNECGQPKGMEPRGEPKLQGKSYDIPKRLVWKAWLKVRSKGGAAGADGVTILQSKRTSEEQSLQTVEQNVVG